MDNNNFEEIKEEMETGKEDPAYYEPVKASDAWHKKLSGNKNTNGNKNMSGRKKSLLIFACILGGMLILGGIFAAVRGIGNSLPGFAAEDISGAASVHESHIGVLYVEGIINEDDDTYDHRYAIDAVEGMMDNDSNEGMMLFVNTPGGGVYESDELYLKIKEYQDTTGRPVYAYLASQATSGGYYISASADKIIANRNCWTGSIGVTIGTLYDISELLKKHGIKTETITSGANKAMGDITVPMTAEQKTIFQSLINESYEQFISIVAEGRNLDAAYVRSIADGRIYTAKQALNNKLVDDIVGTYDEALTDMMDETDLEHCEIYEFRYEPEIGLFDGFVKSIDKLADSLSSDSDISALVELMEENNELPLQYMCEEIK